MRPLALQLVFATIVLASLPVAAEPAPTLACLARLTSVVGLAGDDALDVGGDDGVVIVHVRDGGTPRYFFFSSGGYATIERPLPKGRATVHFAVVLPTGTKRFMWSVQNGKSTSQGSGGTGGHADVIATGWKPLDDRANEIVLRVARLDIPRIAEGLEHSRAFDAEKHMRSGEPLGHEEAYELCHGVLPQLDPLVEAEHARWKKLVATPVAWKSYTVVRRADHPEWTRCVSSLACTMANGPCGYPDAVAKSGKASYERWAHERAEQINCEVPDADSAARATCANNRCVDSAVQRDASWSICSSDADCKAVPTCGDTTAVNQKTLARLGFQRSLWFDLVDNWDRCGGIPASAAEKRARCVNHECVVAP